MEGNDAACTSRTLVQTRTFGSAMRTSVRISPAWFIPSSITATRAPRSSESRESGRPMWLFRFPSFRITSQRVARNVAASSFVLVFPTLPVIATTVAPERRRT